MTGRSMVALVLGMALLLVGGCASKVTKENFDKVLAEKMTEAQVVSLLGKGKLSNRPETPPDMKEFVWQDGGNEIMIQFKDGKAHGGKLTTRMK